MGAGICGEELENGALCSTTNMILNEYLDGV
jgi:hypothetical protein